MTQKYHNPQLRRIMVVMITIALILSNNFGEGKRNVSINNKGSVMLDGAVKTINSVDGDIIDCIDFYKQPAFDHPLLKNHIVQFEPSSYLGGQGLQAQEKLSPIWNDNEECPEGTIPKRRALPHDSQNTMSIAKRRIRTNLQSAEKHEHAVAYVTGKRYTGAMGTLNVWNPKTEKPNELSLSQIWLFGGSGESLNTIEAGWIVLPDKYGDNSTRMFIYWTRDNYKITGCYDLDCPGFVQVDRRIPLGGRMAPVSSYNGKQFVVTIAIHKDPKTGNWWLKLQQYNVGYWPSSIFTNLADAASTVEWGGEVTNTNANGHHTTTAMGSSHFPTEGYGKSSFIRDLKILDDSNLLRDASDLKMRVESPSCYGGSITKSNTFYYGGPGYSAKCQ